MEHDERLNSALAAFRKRIEILVAERAVCWGLAGAGLMAVLLVLCDLFTAWYVIPEVLLALLPLGGIAGLVYARAHRPSALAVALTIERRRELKSRLSTAVAMREEAAADNDFLPLVTADATAHLEGLTPRELFPRTFGRHHRAALVLWALTLVLFLLPSIPWLQRPEVRAERLAMREAGKALREQAKAIKERPELQESEIARQVARNMQKLGVEMEKNRIPKRDALVRMNKLDEQLAKAQKELAKRDQAALQKAAEAVRQSLDARSQQEREAAARARERMNAGTPREKLTPEERAALDREEQMNRLAEQFAQGDMQGAQQTMAKLGQQLQSQQLSPAQRQQLAKALQQLSQATQNSSAQQMSQAAKQAAQGLQQNTPQGQQQAAKALQQCNKPGQRAGNALQSARAQNANARNQVAGNRSGLPCSNCGSSTCNGSCQGNQAGNKPGGQPGGNQPGGNSSQPGGARQQAGGQPGSNSAQGGGRQAGMSSPRPGSGAGMVNTSDRPEESPEAGLTPEKEQTQIDKDQAAYSIDVRGGPDQGDHTSVPYYEVYPDYRKTAESAIENEQVPPGEARRVKEYFTALGAGNE